MGKCKFCGKDAGWFSSSHKECKEKNQIGIEELSRILQSYFAQRTSIADLQRTINRLKVQSYISEEDICRAADSEIRRYTDNIHRPFSPMPIKLMDEILMAIGVSYNRVNQFGAVDEFTKKLMKGFMVEYFTDQLTLQVAHARCEKVLSKFPMSQENILDAYFYVLNKAAINFLKNGIISNSEQQKIDDYVNLLGLPLNNLPSKYQDSDISKIGQSAILNNIQKGIIPTSNFSAPILLGKNESILWTYNNVSLYQEKITKEWVGRTGGFSFRIIKGVYYRTGQIKGKPVEHSTMEFNGRGSLYITNKNLIFHSQQKGLKIPFSKIIGIDTYSDGIEVHKDGKKETRLTMQGFDPWFLLNVLSHINSL